MEEKLSRKTALMVADSAQARQAAEELNELYRFTTPQEAEVLLVLGGDGFMLDILHSWLGRNVDIYGMNLGTVGFLLNPFSCESLEERLLNAEKTLLAPLQVHSWREDVPLASKVAFNDVSVLRASTQSAHLKVHVDGVLRIADLVGDGVLVSTSAGSSAYNASAGGPVLPLKSDILALTPVCTSSHRHWRGALLSASSRVEIEVLSPTKRPVSVDADSSRLEGATRLRIEQRPELSASVLFDPGHALEERILALQFG